MEWAHSRGEQRAPHPGQVHLGYPDGRCRRAAPSLLSRKMFSPEMIITSQRSSSQVKRAPIGICAAVSPTYSRIRVRASSKHQTIVRLHLFACCSARATPTTLEVFNLNRLANPTQEPSVASFTCSARADYSVCFLERQSEAWPDARSADSLARGPTARQPASEPNVLYARP